MDVRRYATEAAQSADYFAVLLNNVADLGFNLITGANPVVGTIRDRDHTRNETGAFNVSNAVIT